MIGDTTRIMSISIIKFKVQNKNEILKLNNELTHTLSLVTVYFPHSGYKACKLDQFSNEISEFLAANIPAKNNTTIISADINTSIGLHNDKRISFTLSFKYLGSIITSLLNEDAEI